MPIFLVLSYAMSIWMIVDAYKRGSQGWWIVIILVPLGEWIYFFAVKFQDFDFSNRVFNGGGRFKCADCKYCVALYRNGVKCRIRDETIYKMPAQIDYCGSYTPVERSR